MNKNEEQAGGFPGKNFENSKDVLSIKFCLNINPYQHLIMHILGIPSNLLIMKYIITITIQNSLYNIVPLKSKFYIVVKCM